MTLPCEDANSKLDVVFTVANVDIGKYVDETLVQIWKLKFSQKTECLFRLWDRGLIMFFFKLKFRRHFESLKFGQNYAANGWLKLWSRILDFCLKLGLGTILKFKFSQFEMLMFDWYSEVDAFGQRKVGFSWPKRWPPKFHKQFRNAGPPHIGPKSLILAPQDIPDISRYQLGFGCQCVKANNNENPVTNQKIL